MAKNISRPRTRNKEGRISMNRISLKQVETSERFFRLPKALFYDNKYKDMMLESKNAHASIKDRFELSLQNGWIDKNGDVYLIFKNQDLQELLQVGEKKVIAIKKELNKFELLEEERQGLNKPNRLYIGNISTSKSNEKLKNEVIHRAKPLGDAELSKRQSNDTELSDTKLSDTQITKTDDDEQINNISSLTVNTKVDTDPLIKTGKLLENNIDLRPIVHKLIPDLLMDDTFQALEVVTALVSAKQFLSRELGNGNTVLKQRQIVRGQDCITSLIEDIASKQLAYMNENLVNSNRYGQYFQKGLNQRLKIAITTDKFVAGY
ncbi:replication initiator protein A [Leuconostoc citreum]|uniref:replication initiator protein A n=1 Tax=Leuconostoc citreum TaxID=33964 RepID=UPI0032DFCDD0